MISSYFPLLKSLLWLLFAATIIGRCFCNGRRFNTTAGCIPIERLALLEIKSNFSDPSNRLASWNHVGADCCRWYGVVCDKVTGHVLELHLSSISFYAYSESPTPPKDYLGGRVSPSLLKLKHLMYLDLSNNNFGGLPIPKFIGSMGSLRTLIFNYAGFGGNIPYQLGNLSNLQYLSIGDYYIQTDNLHWLSSLSSLQLLELANVKVVNASSWLEDVNTLPSLKELLLPNCSLVNANIPALPNINFSSLSILDLSGNGLTQPSHLQWISQLHSLTYLNLAGNQFHGPIPIFLQNLTSLRELDLSENFFNSSIPMWFYGFYYLEILNLRNNQLLQGDISSDFENLTSLTSLDLSFTGLEGPIPISFKNLCNLRSLQLVYVKLKQEINELLQILTGCVSNGLQILLLSYCQLSGHLTHHLGQFKALEALLLGYNGISGPIPTSIGQMKSLKTIYFGGNNLNGTLPLNFGGLTKLEHVDISVNFLAGDVLEVHFTNLSELRRFAASRNQLSLRVGSKWSPPFQQITELYLDSWLIGPQFPTWLGSLKYLSKLGLSNSGISSTIPHWFWQLSMHLKYVDLSHNEIEGVLPDKFDTPSSFETLFLSANLLEGPLTPIFFSTKYLDLSNNSLSGSLSEFLCSDIHVTNSMEFLILEGNMLQGEMPDCWMNWSELKVIELSNNKFHGHVPMSIGTLDGLESLHLRNNNLSGNFPLSLGNCSELLTLDLSQNQFMGILPNLIWKRLQVMMKLNLRENNFHGHLPRELCHLSSMQILDLANNYFDGPIPNCINKLSAMVMENASSDPSPLYFIANYLFMEKVFVMVKGELVEYNSTSYLVRSLDLSSNKLSGEIPKEITNLKELQSLNLSHNLLNGRIPEDIGAMKSLESMDFSQNQLSGKIPQSLANLNFLSKLNLSYNNLSGRIPLGTQIQSFDSSSFYGNKDLCGKPLSNCTEEGIASGAPQDKVEVGNGLRVDWFYVSMSLGFAVGLCGVLAPLVFSRRWRYQYFLFLDLLGHKIYWRFH